MPEITLLVLRSRRRRKKRRQPQHFVPKVCTAGVLRSWWRESLQVDPPWPKGRNNLKKWWRGLKLRFQSFNSAWNFFGLGERGGDVTTGVSQCANAYLPGCGAHPYYWGS